MQVTVIYAVSYASAIGLLLLWRLSQYLSVQAREHIFSTFSKWFIYSVALPRLRGSNDVTILASVIITLVYVANIIVSVLSVRDRAELSIRLAKLAATNLVFLYYGGRSNPLLDKIFRLCHTEQSMLHRWIGRVVVVEGLIHGTLEMIRLRSMTLPIHLSLYTILGAITLFSILHVRRRIYECFLRTHSLLALAALVLLWLHVGAINKYLLTCFSSAAAFYLLQKASWLSYFLYQNVGSGPSCEARMSPISPTGEVVQVRIDVKRPWRVVPGQFIYLTLPRLRSLGFGLLESHPFMVAWTEENERGHAKRIVLLVKACRGFTRRLKFADPGKRTPALIDGPYGGAETEALKSYDKVLLMSSGIGIAAHLSTARYLLLAHDNQTARVRRLTLVWHLETQDQINWVREFLCALIDMDHREILTIFCYYPSHTDGSSEGRSSTFPQLKKRILSLSTEFDMAWFIQAEWDAEAGNMLVAVCGSPQFELRARKAVRSNPHDIDFKNSVFQPDGNRD